MEAREFLDLAQKLANSTNEASLRSSVSRGYYALYNSMAQIIEENIERLPKDASAHDKVYIYFFNCGVEEIRAIASNLNDLRGDRNASDYDLNKTKFQNVNLVSLLFSKAKIAFNAFERIIRQGKRRDQIIKKIKEYKEKTNS